MTDDQIKTGQEAIKELADILEVIGIKELKITPDEFMVIWESPVNIKALERFADLINQVKYEVENCD
ncbi:hypothetical protein AB6735_18605 [Mucilaginibacter sp. RCC_168]|uniref:hypothetical protein n=1 Tax=Mucilaginibacter sp. RCC_168 TaxID=3239221 RepID=UPI0035231FFE